MKGLMLRYLLVMAVWFFSSAACNGIAYARSAQEIVEDSFNYIRGKTSTATVTMTIHRKEWERTMTIKAWTKGMDESIFWISAPPKDYGNGTLKQKQEMWVYNPKINRVIKIPPSMMSQSWMGSDFSNNDLVKSDTLINDYTHSITATEEHEGQKVYVIKSVPKPRAPVVWGMQILRIREDNVFLFEEFYDEDLKPVKTLTTEEIGLLGGKLFPKIWKMHKSSAENEYTLLEYSNIEFDLKLPDTLFSLSSLKNPRLGK